MLTSHDDKKVEPIEREAVRVVLLDGRNRILLQECEFPESFEVPDKRLWITPGGGIDSNESHEDAAVRELSEELGLDGAVVEGPIWTREHSFTFEGKVYEQRETFYVARVDSHEVKPTELLDPFVLSHRWWTLKQIEAVDEITFAPRQLARHLRDLLNSGPTSTPVDVGV